MSRIVQLIQEVLERESELNQLNLSSSACRKDLAEKIAKKIERLH